MHQPWPALSTEAADVVRSVCQRLLADAEALTDALTGPARTAQKDPTLVNDASLAAEDRQLNRSDLVQWLTANIQRPGARVEPYFDARTAAYIRDLTSRGIAPDFAGGWRAALGVAWRHWLRACLAQCSDPALLVEILDVAAQSMAQYAIDSVTALHEASLADALNNANGGAIAMIQLLLSGASIPPEFAEARLNYRLGRWHQALVLWTDDVAHVDELDALVAVVRAPATGRNALVARASTTARWVWLSGSTAPDLVHVEKAAARGGGVQVAVGRPGQGLEGFRASHQDALAAQAMIVRLRSDRRVTAYADVELIDTLTKDRPSAQRFVTRTLGRLAEADASLRQALLTYVQCGFNTTRAAAALHAHRNTVERRVTRANELSSVKVEDNPTHVAAALLVMEVAPHIATLPDFP